MNPEYGKMLAPCDDDQSRCVPDVFINSMGKFIAPSCVSVAGSEGRCLSTCIPLVAAQAQYLPQSSCKAGEKCAPCYDPTTQKDTGACHQGCDPGPKKPPVVFDSCCAGTSICVPVELVGKDLRQALSQGDCKKKNTVCVPKKLTDPKARAAGCTSLQGDEGRCLPKCLPDIARQASRLPQDKCEAHHLCAPCYDPLTGKDTHACRINGDAPQKPPVVFQGCCKRGPQTLGKCVPASLAPPDARQSLGRDSCDSEGALCVPEKLTNPATKPQSCTSLSGAEGRCLPDCLPAVAQYKDWLPQDVCGTNHRCAPCYDPLSGEDTGACRVNADRPTKAPVVFGYCCRDGARGPRGRCIPNGLIPEDDRNRLPSDSCSREYRCVPNELVKNPQYHFPGCSAPGPLGAPATDGACVPSCIVGGLQIFQGSFIQQGECQKGDLCAPCTIFGIATGACR
jgi:hypothetical protein